MDFSPNQYFSDSTLWAEFYYSTQLDSSHPHHFEDLTISHMRGSRVTWKANMESPAPVKGVPNSGTFFNLFNPPLESIEEPDLPRNVLDTLTNNFEIGELFRYTVIPRAVNIYHGDFWLAKEDPLESDSSEDETDNSDFERNSYEDSMEI